MRSPGRKRLARRLARRVYGQRWLAQTVVCVVKRKFPDRLTARTEERPAEDFNRASIPQARAARSSSSISANNKNNNKKARAGSVRNFLGPCSTVSASRSAT